MTEAKHTPGPWKIIDLPNADGIGIVPTKLPKGVTRRDAEDIASISKSNEQHDSRANARLIVAAPDLLAACQAVLAFRADLVLDVRGMVEAAVEKATA